MTLEAMTQQKWDALSYAEREKLRDTSDLSSQLKGLEGLRVEVLTTYGEVRRFKVGKSTGWRPVHLELANSRSSGGPAAEKEYKSVRVIR